MFIEALSNFVDGDNKSKSLRLTVDEQYRSLNVYLYFVPVEGDEVYVSDEITLTGGHADYEVPADVLNGEGYFGAQIVCIGNNSVVAKSEPYIFECAEKFDGSQAVTPTGQVITLADLYEQLNELDASDVGYSDTYLIGTDTVQGAIDYALEHGGGSHKTYKLYWYANPTQAQVEANVAVLQQIFASEEGTFNAYLINGRNIIPITRVDTQYKKVSALLLWGTDIFWVYEMSGLTVETYRQAATEQPNPIFDEWSGSFAGMMQTADYITQRIGTSGNLDPSSYASASDVDAIESKIPNAASSSNQLADKNFVNSSVATNTSYFIGTFDSVAELEAYSGTVTNNDYAFVIKYSQVVPTEVEAYDRYKYNADTSEWLFEYELNNSSFTAAQWAAINSAITASLVSDYSAHVANATIHVTSQDKTDWNAKYDKPAGGIPDTDLSNDVQNSLALANSALQSIPEASTQTLGGVKVGDRLTINNGILSAAPLQVSSGTVIELEDHTEYRLDNVTDLTLTYPQTNFECWLKLTFAASGTITVTLPTSSYIGSAPTFANGETWEISIKDGVVVAGKAEE